MDIPVFPFCLNKYYRFCIIAKGLSNDVINHLLFQMFPHVLLLIRRNYLKSVFEGGLLTEMNRMFNCTGTCQSLFLWQNTPCKASYSATFCRL